jgi:hypothetical protein
LCVQDLRGNQSEGDVSDPHVALKFIIWECDKVLIDLCASAYSFI